MAPAIPLVAAVAGYGASVAIGGGILGALGGFLVSTAISQIGGRALSKKPKQPAFSADAGGRTTIVRSSVESHKVIYGQAKVSGPLAFVATTDTGFSNQGGTTNGTNKFLHMVIPLAGHEVEEIGTVYLNDVALTLDADGWATNAPYAKETTTTATNTVSATLTSLARASNVVTGTTTGAHGFSVGERVTINGTGDNAFKGTFTIATTPTSTTFTYAQTGVNQTKTSGTASVQRTNTTTSTKSFARVRKKLGTADQEADPVMTSSIVGWSVNHRLRGIAYVYVCLEFDNDVFPLGIPNVSAIVKGKKVFDPRTATTAWSDNAALCVRDYLSSAYGFGCDDDEINDDYFSASANICDESVTLAAGGTQDRYTCNGVVDTAVAPLDNLGSLVTSLAGAVTYVQGKFRLHAGAYDAPVMDIPITMLAGPVKVRARTPRKELFNAVKGTYVAPDKQWQPTDFPFVTNATYEAQDGGERIYKDLELPFTTDPERAQRIAKIILEKGRQGIVVEMAMMHHGMQLAVFDTVTVTNEQMGWDEKVFRVIKWSATGHGVVNVVLQEESSASYSWNSGEATTIDPAPDTNLPNSLEVQPPGTPLVTETLYVTTDGSGVKTKATVAWPASNDGFLRDYQVEYALTTATSHTIAGRTTATTMDILDLAPGQYRFRVKAMNTLGVSSEYSAAAIKTLFGLTEPPTDVQNFSLNVNGAVAQVSWDQATDLDVKIGGTVRIRWTPTLTGQNWNAAVDIGPALPGIATQASLPLLAGTYMAKFVDSTGNASTAPALIVTDAVDLTGLNLVETMDEHPAFAGDKDGVVYDDALGSIKLAGAADWDDYPGDIDEWPMVDSLGGIGAEGTYDGGVIDLGAVYPCRVTAAISAYGYDTGDLIDSRLGNIDTWTSFDGSGNTDFTDDDLFEQVGVTVLGGAAIAPDGTMTADRIAEDTEDSEHGLEVNYGNPDEWPFISSQGGNYTITAEVYVKPEGRDLQLFMDSTPSGTAYANFDLANGTVDSASESGALAVADSGITPSPNGYFRCWLTVVCTDAGPERLVFRLLEGFDDLYEGDGTSGLSLWGSKIYYGPVQPESVIDDVNAEIYIRTTNDDPALENWSEWRRFFVGDYTARAFQPRIRLTSGDPNHNVVVTESSLTVDMPEREERGRNITSGAGTYSVNYAYPFREAPTIAGITMKGGSTGDYWTISNEAEAGFDIIFRNSGGTAVSRVFDYSATGYGKQVA